MAIPGSKYVFLVQVKSAGTGTVNVEATAVGAKIVEPLLDTLVPGVVGEIWVVADPTTAETTASLQVKATRGSVVKTVERSLPVFPMTDERAKDAQPYFTSWVKWLAANKPEFGITTDTTFEPVFVSTLLVVSHYAYWSKDWEITVAWHNMIPPYDWTEVYLRKRGVDTVPSLAFKIDSVSAASEAHVITPPDAIVR